MKILILILALILFQACAAKKLAVEHADSFIESSVTQRLPLTASQKAVLAKDIDGFLTKKKSVAQDLLPVIDQVKLDQPEKFDSLYQKFLTYYKDLTVDFSQIMAKHIASLDANQQKKFFEKLEDENESMLKKKESVRVEQTERKIERLIGSLNKQQEKFFDDHQSYLGKKFKARMDRREKLHGELKTILKQEADVASKQTKIQEAFATYQNESIESSYSNLPLIKEFLPSMSMQQKEYFRERVRDLRQMINYYIEADY